MVDPELYREYARSDAVALFTAREAPREVCGGQWVLSSLASLCFCALGPAPGAPHFSSGRTFHWVADRPYRATDDDAPFLPKEVRGGAGVHPPIHLFLRAPGSSGYTYAGPLQATYAYAHPGGTTSPYGAATFKLQVTLPSAVWHRLGGPAPREGGTAALDRSLAPSALQAGVSSRLRALRKLAEYWHGPFGAQDGYPEDQLAGRPAPEPLAWWYRFGGRRGGIVSGFNELYPPDELEADETDRVVFLAENQRVYLWSTSPVGEDPPVWVRKNEVSEPWVREEATLSGFLIQACLLEAVWSAPYGGFAPGAGASLMGRITAPLAEVPLGAWRWPVYPTRFWAGSGVFVMTTESESEARAGVQEYDVYVAARTEQPLAYLKDVLPAAWVNAAF